MSIVPSDREVIPAACVCGWDNDGSLVVVDRYISDWPPGPRGDGTGFLEVYLDRTGDPDDLVDDCPECGNDLWPEDLIERTP